MPSRPLHVRHGFRALLVVAFAAALPGAMFAAGGTSIVATKGHPVTPSDGWPAGVEWLVNDALRTTGWNSWFTEWPNDVNQYAFEAKSTDDINKLLMKLAKIKSDVRHVHLSYRAEPDSLGWVTRLPEDNKIPVVFSIGNQATIDEWYKHVRKPFGVMEFTAAPVAVPPTITIFVGNQVVKLDELKIPEGVEVAAGEVPTVFLRSNTKLEQQQVKAAAQPKAAAPPRPKLDAASQATLNAIEKFLERRKGD